jgi:NAD(P)H-dependent FMN reductase
MSTLYIPVLAGTTRPKRMSIHAARLVFEVGKTRKDIAVELVDPQDYTFPYDGNDPENKDPRYTSLTEKADAFFIVVPEYNHSIPGSLKRMLDSELQNYKHKAVAVAGVSASPWGGIRAIESILPIVRELGLVVTHTDVQFPSVFNLFNDKAELQDETYIKRVNRAYDELVWMAKALKWGRENL